jgi:hypothetical protein
VKPPRFLGERLEGIGPVEIPDHPPIRLEVYIIGEETEEAETRGISLYAAGTLVSERFDELAALGLDRHPWTDSRLTGMIDFPGLQVVPGSRRGVVPNETAGLFAEALRNIEPLLAEILDAREREKAEKLDRSLVRDLQRAFRDFYRHRPRYTMLPIQTKQDNPSGPDTSDGDAGEGSPEDTPVSPDHNDSIYTKSPPPQEDLFPPGPLAEVRITPPQLRVECGGTRRAGAQAFDERGRAIRSTATVDVQFTWELWGPIGSLTETPDKPDQILYTAVKSPIEGILSVHATCGEKEASAVIPVEVIEKLPAGPSDEGIPEPELVDQPGAPWRSRILDGRWQVNTGHPDYKAAATRPALKLRYFAFLFAKEVVLRSSQDPRLDSPLEQVVEVAAFADRRITERQTPRRRRKDSKQ